MSLMLPCCHGCLPLSSGRWLCMSLVMKPGVHACLGCMHAQCRLGLMHPLAGWNRRKCTLLPAFLEAAHSMVSAQDGEGAASRKRKRPATSGGSSEGASGGDDPAGAEDDPRASQ